MQTKNTHGKRDVFTKSIQNHKCCLIHENWNVHKIKNFSLPTPPTPFCLPYPCPSSFSLDTMMSFYAKLLSLFYNVLFFTFPLLVSDYEFPFGNLIHSKAMPKQFTLSLSLPSPIPHLLHNFCYWFLQLSNDTFRVYLSISLH